VPLELHRLRKLKYWTSLLGAHMVLFLKLRYKDSHLLYASSYYLMHDTDAFSFVPMGKVVYMWSSCLLLTLWWELSLGF